MKLTWTLDEMHALSKAEQQSLLDKARERGQRIVADADVGGYALVWDEPPTAEGWRRVDADGSN